MLELTFLSVKDGENEDPLGQVCLRVSELLFLCATYMYSTDVSITVDPVLDNGEPAYLKAKR